MIVICHKSLDSVGLDLERDFLKNHLARTSKKHAVVANEVWDTWRNKVLSKYQGSASKQLIGLYRGWVQPEIIYLDENYKEREPKLIVKEEGMIEKTKDLVDRKWADIDVFITETPEKYGSVKVKMMTLGEFFLNAMNDENKRPLIEGFMRRRVQEQ